MLCFLEVSAFEKVAESLQGSATILALKYQSLKNTYNDSGSNTRERQPPALKNVKRVLMHFLWQYKEHILQ